MNTNKYSFYTKEDPHIRRIHTNLAIEIGFNESIILLQFDHLININTNNKIHEDRYWTYDSIKSLQEKYFPFWGTTTIKKALTSLESQNLIIKGNYNKAGFDKTNWYAINYEEAAKLKSILVGYTDEGGCVQRLVGMCPTIGRNLTNDWSESDQPIPETSSKTSSKISSYSTEDDFSYEKSLSYSTVQYKDKDNSLRLAYKEKEKNELLNSTYKEKEKNTSFAAIESQIKENIFSDTLVNDAQKIKKYKSAGTDKFYRRQKRSKVKFEKGEIPAALSIIEEDRLPKTVEDYLNHEIEMYDTKNTKSLGILPGQFLIEAAYKGPCFIHYCKMTEEQREYELKVHGIAKEDQGENKSLLEIWRDS